MEYNKEGKFIFFVCRNAYKNSWPDTLLPKPLLMGYRQWPQSDRNMSLISSEKSRIYGLEQSPAPVSDILLLIGLLMHQTPSEGSQVPPPQDPLGPAPVSERVRCVPTPLSWTQTHKPRLDSCVSAATRLRHDSGVLTSLQLEKGMIITSTHLTGTQ